MGINKVILVGRLGRDPEIRYTTDNTAVATLSLATGERKKDASGQWINYTEWHRLVCFGKLAEVARDFLKKGRPLYVEGKLRTNNWQDKEGKDRYTTEILVSNFEFFGNKDQEPANDNPFADVDVADTLITNGEDDIPF